MVVFFGLDFSVAGLLVLLIKALLAFVLIVIADEVIAHQFEWKHTLLMALLALFATPIVTTMMNDALNLPVYFDLVASLIVWVIAGEILLREGDWETKLKVTLVAFIGYTLIAILGAPFIESFVSTYVV